MKKVWTGLLLAAFVSGTAEAGTLRGVVEIAGADGPVAGARVKVLGTAVVVNTNAKGVFTLELPDGVYRLEIAAPGYMTTTMDVKLTGEVKKSVSLVAAEGLITTWTGDAQAVIDGWRGQALGLAGQSSATSRWLGLIVVFGFVLGLAGCMISAAAYFAFSS